MKTAREQLYDETIALLARPATDAAGAEMRKIMARYRVQTKPGVNVAPGSTARDALGDLLVGLWRAGTSDDATRQKISTTIDEFRMQLKVTGPAGPAAPPPDGALAARVQKAKAAVVAAPRPQKAPPLAPSPGRRPLPAPPPTTSTPRAPARPAVTLSMGEAPKGAVGRAEPVAGGPRQRKKQRGECPKCHSMGVVLARSYSGDEYYSCIYCGWQAYKPGDDDDPNALLALRLLGPSTGGE